MCPGVSDADQSGSLAARTAKGAGWLIGWRLASRLLGILNTVVLVRLLLPSDFGLLALATSFSFAIDGMSYIGVQDALIREPVLDRPLYDTGFTMTLLRGSLTALLIVACAWPAARFFGDARLAAIFLALAFGMFLTALENIGTIDFQRDLTFGKQVRIMFVPRVASVIVSIACAVVWRSYWALVAGMLVARGMRVVFTYAVHPYRPRLSLRAWRRLIGFSAWSWGLSIASLLQTRSDTIILGGYLNPAAVGVYSVGGEVGSLPTSELMEPISRVLYAGFSSARRTGGGVASAYIRAISLLVLLTLPASAGLALIARPMMHLVFGSRWDAAVPLVQLFAFIGMFRTSGAVSAVLLTAEGLVARAFRVEVVSAVLRVALLLALVPHFGLLGAAGAVAVIALVEEAFYLVITFRHTGLRARDLALGMWRPALATGVMSLVVLAAGLDQPLADVGVIWSSLGLAATALLGAVIYGGTLWLAWFASGRPRGAESYILAMIWQATALRHWLGR